VDKQLDGIRKEEAVDQSEELKGICQQNHQKFIGITSTQAGISTQNLKNTKWQHYPLGHITYEV